MTLAIRLWTLAIALCALVNACGSGPNEPDRGTLAGKQASSGGVGAGGTAETGGFNFAGGAVAAGGATGSGGADATGGFVDPSVCGGKKVEPEVIEVEVSVEVTKTLPVAIYIMLDQSGSMVPLWPGAVQAITDFVNDPASSGLDVALSLFPPALGLDGCAAASYNPPMVPLGRLPGYAGTITGGLPPLPIGAGTPIEGALKGATEFCKNFSPADPADAGEQCVVLFITDGAPSGCAIDTPTIVGVSQAAQVPVYTIALQGVTDLNLLNMIADSTGTDCDPASANGDSFIDALTLIRDTVVTVETHTETMVKPLTCEWGLPDPDPVQGFDKDEVNVVLSSPAGDITFVKAADEASCGDSDNAWYYDDPDNPTRIAACPKTCEVIEAAQGASVDIQLGCPTMILK